MRIIGNSTPLQKEGIDWNRVMKWNRPSHPGQPVSQPQTFPGAPPSYPSAPEEAEAPVSPADIQRLTRIYNWAERTKKAAMELHARLTEAGDLEYPEGVTVLAPDGLVALNNLISSVDEWKQFSLSRGGYPEEKAPVSSEGLAGTPEKPAPKYPEPGRTGEVLPGSKWAGKTVMFSKPLNRSTGVFDVYEDDQMVGSEEFILYSDVKWHPLAPEAAAPTHAMPPKAEPAASPSSEPAIFPGPPPQASLEYVLRHPKRTP